MSVTVLVSESSRRWARELDDRMERWRERHQLRSLPTGAELAAKPARDLRLLFSDPIIPRDALSELQQELEVICGEIRAAVLAAKANAHDGIYLPPKEFKALLKEQAEYNAKFTAVKTELSRRKLSDKRSRARQRDFANYFMDVAREGLDPELFNRLCELAKQAKSEAVR